MSLQQSNTRLTRVNFVTFGERWADGDVAVCPSGKHRCAAGAVEQRAEFA